MRGRSRTGAGFGSLFYGRLSGGGQLVISSWPGRDQVVIRSCGGGWGFQIEKVERDEEAPIRVIIRVRVILRVMC